MSLDFIINDQLSHKIFGCFFDIRPINNKKHFEVQIDNLVKNRIKAKSSLKINFLLNKFVEVTSEGKNIIYSNFTPEDYRIVAYLYDYDFPDYELDIPDKFKILSNQVNFEILEDIPDEIVNISIKLTLSKSVYRINESINGSINISKTYH